MLDHEDDGVLAATRSNGLREVALGIESGARTILAAMDKRITPEMTLNVTRRLLEHGIRVKGYFILGYPGETREKAGQTIRHIKELRGLSDRLPGTFRASAFTFRPYPGSPVFDDLVNQGYDPLAMQTYSDVDLTAHGADEAMRGRDESTSPPATSSARPPSMTSTGCSPTSPASSTTAPTAPGRRQARDRPRRSNLSRARGAQPAPTTVEDRADTRGRPGLAGSSAPSHLAAPVLRVMFTHLTANEVADRICLPLPQAPAAVDRTAPSPERLTRTEARRSAGRARACPSRGRRVRTPRICACSSRAAA
ncbi:radical SAM protein [Streptomyces uncialis]|uniref:radical SAM protein n=1 Tax=Streptomyces uncialis TaxID=1048205 RepID=UPI0022528D05|nr:radical SAM protein [Streptomyces uncialis]MCX4657938.1 radical SAM protein [Streptomyces uncialis]